MANPNHHLSFVEDDDPFEGNADYYEDYPESIQMGSAYTFTSNTPNPNNHHNSMGYINGPLSNNRYSQFNPDIVYSRPHSRASSVGFASPQHHLLGRNIPLQPIHYNTHPTLSNGSNGSDTGSTVTLTTATNLSKIKEFPSAYQKHTTNSSFGEGTMFQSDYESGNPFQAPLQVGFSGANYMINPLEDADNDDDFDPFGDNDSLYSETGEEIIRRGATIKRRNTMKNGGDYPDEDDEYFVPKLHYTKTIKKAKLINGNYIIDAKVPTSLLETYNTNNESGKEMSFLRYTGATCGPSNFQKFKYNLRQELYTPKRDTELMVVVTMYNEDEFLLARTLKGVFENIKNLSERKNSSTWGPDSWKKVVICIVADGRLELNKRSQLLLTALGVYQDGYAKSKINDKTVKAHIYEYTSMVGIDEINDKIHFGSNSNPVQLMFCLKEKNSKKINSHRWCFQAFAPILNPKVVMLLDCGTKPEKDAFYYLWRSFKDPNVGGACGEMRVALGPSRQLLANPLVAAQHFEYKISNILDKPLESVFGFISVLPGAFSAYRYEALLNVNGKGPLEKYFKGEFLHQSTNVDDEEEDDERDIKERNFRESGIFTSNMYLAEDRILCFELVAKRNHNYILRYVNEAKAETDAPENIDEFVLQRRRWLNGSMFAAVYAIFHWSKIWRSEHSLFRKLILQVEFYYQLVTILVSWFSLASFFLVFRILTANLGGDTMHFDVGKYLAAIFLWCYVGAVVTAFVLAFGNTPRGARKFYTAIAVIFAVLMAYLMFAVVFLAVHTVKAIIADNNNHFEVSLLFTNSKFRDLILSIISTYVLYFAGAFLYGEPTFMFTSFVQYVLLSPYYVNVLNIYAFCNIHDVSWGTKGAVQAKDLGSAKIVNNKDEFVMIVPGVESELNESYINTIDALRTEEPIKPIRPNKKSKDDSYYALVRTITVLIWMFSNAILIAIVLQAGGVLTGPYNTNANSGALSANSQVFLSIILWIVAGLALFRFLGSVFYLLFKAFRPLKWKIRGDKGNGLKSQV
ncbi:chitin synthase-domain-containing protein [Scheffersomyces amazonensis]|uniref:chitin synthase-domain-containing protein n=1 Tax=Scheffersomyces amazonensis TaxID=1078765 RepID=UPI00315D3CEC